jgi:hypothetical protein
MYYGHLRSACAACAYSSRTVHCARSTHQCIPTIKPMRRFRRLAKCLPCGYPFHYGCYHGGKLLVYIVHTQGCRAPQYERRCTCKGQNAFSYCICYKIQSTSVLRSNGGGNRCRSSALTTKHRAVRQKIDSHTYLRQQWRTATAKPLKSPCHAQSASPCRPNNGRLGHRRLLKIARSRPRYK